MIEIGIDIREPRVELCLPAETESLPVVRQALRSLGETVQADQDALEDAELAVTEACANVVEHAYDGGPGSMEVRLEPNSEEIVVTVSDHGRGMPDTEMPRDDLGFGLVMIEGIATRMEIRPRDRGTDLVMSLGMGARTLSLNGSAPPESAPLERIARRTVAVIAAQADMPTDRLVESLLAVELAARYAPGYLRGDRIQLTLERVSGGFDLRLGPLVTDGAKAVVHASELPAIGAVIERLSDQVMFEPEEPGEGERLRLLIGASSGGSG